MKSAWKWSLPLAVFAALVIFLYVGLYRDPREVPSPLIGKPAPAFALRQLDTPQQTLGTADMHGKVWLLNVWASWCESCRIEHPLLVEMARQNLAPIIGLDYKDKDDLGKAWLAERGNPYAASVVDADGRVGIDWGVYGVPETFVIDKRGVIRYKQIGPVTAEALQRSIVPLIRELRKES
ncbi:MAG: DsbE family thiol:disulfide interchange protein [Casimicrobiaceae bacterium]